jgi:arylsulfatase A-like enzyme
VAENTLILFIGDNGSDAPLGPTHGYSSSAPLRGKKGTHYEGGMRVPFIAAWAKPATNSIQKKFPIKKGIFDQKFASICDVFPTLLSVAGIKADSNHIIDGSDITKDLAGSNSPHKQQFLMHFPHGHRSQHFTVFRENNLKLIYHYKKTGANRYELFDLIKDPYEKSNIAESNEDDVKRMITSMRDELERTNALYSTPKKGDSPLKPE